MSVFDGAGRDELLWMAGVFYLDNRRLRAIVAKMAPLALGMPEARALSREERDDVMYVMRCYAQDLGDKKLIDALNDVTPSGERRRRKKVA